MAHKKATASSVKPVVSRAVVELTAEQREILEALCNGVGQNYSDVIRRLIMAAWRAALIMGQIEENKEEIIRMLATSRKDGIEVDGSNIEALQDEITDYDRELMDLWRTAFGPVGVVDIAELRRVKGSKA